MPKPAEKPDENNALTSLLYDALREPIGLLVQTNEPDKLRKRLYQLRTLAEDQELDRIQIAGSPLPGGNIVIVKVQRAEQPDEKKSLPAAAERLLDL